MNRKEVFEKIASVAVDGGFTYLDVISVFPGVEPARVGEYIKTAYKLDFISATPNGLTYYPTPKLRKIRAGLI